MENMRSKFMNWRGSYFRVPKNVIKKWIVKIEVTFINPLSFRTGTKFRRPDRLRSEILSSARN